MTVIESLPYPLSRREVRRLDDLDGIRGVPVGFVNWGPETDGTVARAFIVETGSERVAVAEDDAQTAYRVLARGEGARAAYDDWLNANGYGDDQW